MSDNSHDTQRDFIRDMIVEDLRTGKHGGRVATRFPPEPNGYLHIGHAKSICLNFGVAAELGGTCNLRFDDTNPETEDMEYVRSIQEDVRWLGFDWKDRRFFASDYFERLYDLAVKLVRDGKAYVDSVSEEEMRELRGTISEPGRPSPFRDRSVEENLDLLERMRRGEFPDGSHVLRARIDLAAANMLMRDPVLYRIRRDARHYRRGDAWAIYPMYDYTHCLSDSFEDITHSLCTLEFENNREIYDWLIRETEVPCKPEQTEFARLNLSYTVLSKRRLLELVRDGHVAGWDDPRMPTLSGLRRRGYTPESIRAFCDRVGVAKTHNVIDLALLEFSIRDDLNPKVPRVQSVLRPLKLVIENYPEDRTEELEAPFYPHDVPLEGSRLLPFSRVLCIERDDFMENPPAGYHRLAPGREVRLRYAYFVRCVGVVKDDGGEIVEVRCTYDPETRGGNAPDGRKVAGTLHWVSARHAVPAEVRLYDRLFRHHNPDGDREVDFKDHLNPRSLEVLAGSLVEPAVAAARPGDRYQFERQGYFIADAEDSAPGHLVFNRIVTLRDTWAKISTRDGAGSTVEDDLAARRAAEKAAHKTRQRELAGAQEERPLTPRQEAVAARYRDDLGLNDHDARLLAADGSVAAFFEAALERHPHPRTVANWVVHEVLREVKDRDLADLPFGGGELGELAALVDDGTVTVTLAKEVFAEMVANGGAPREIVERQGLVQLSDAGELGAVVDRVLADHPAQVDEYRAGKTALLGFFVGRVMKATGGRANPELVHELLGERL